MADHEPKPRAEPGHAPAADGKTVHEKAKKNKKEKKHEGSSSLEVCSSNLSYRDRELMLQLAPPPEFIDHRIQIFEKHWTKYQAELASSCPKMRELAYEKANHAKISPSPFPMENPKLSNRTRPRRCKSPLASPSPWPMTL
jgi:hypothetical protein